MGTEGWGMEPKEAMFAGAMGPRLRVPDGGHVSRGLKLLLIALLAMAMSLLAVFVDVLTSERSTDAQAAHQEVSAQVVGRYVALAPTYQSVERSLKYAPLFLGLVFLAYFLFEVTTRRRVHMAQYALVGVAQLIFYLLLLSFAEHVGFDWGFLIGGGATVLLLAWNAGWVFQQTSKRWQALCIFAGLYLVIYGLLRLQNNALLLGALCSFAAVAAAMFFTRNLDWFGTGALAEVSPSVANATGMEA